MYTGQTGKENFVKLSIGLHHYVELVDTIEKHIWNIQVGVQMRKLCLPEDLHPGLGLTGQTGPETGQTDPKCRIRVRSCILTRDLLGFRLLMGIDLPTLYI